MNFKLYGLITGPLLFFIVLLFLEPQGMPPEALAVLACTLWMAVWWVTEAVHITVTALLPIVLFPLTGALDISATTAAFGHKYVFLYLGGFILAAAITKWDLHKRISLTIIHLIGTGIDKIILGFMIATAFISMWISNTATTVMMLPIGMAVVRQLIDNPDTKEDENLLFGKALMLAIAYSATTGGIATLIGTPPNLVLAGIVQETYGVEITFAQWITFGLPISLTLLTFSWIYLTKIAFKFKDKSFPGGRQEVKRLLNNLGETQYEEKAVFVVFLMASLLWISRSLLQSLIPALDDSIIAMIAAISLFLIPSKTKGKPLIEWKEAVQIPWGIIILFGGGMALALGFRSSGLAEWIGGQMTLLSGLSLIFLLLILIAAVNLLTEITSNLATTAMLLPILAPMALIIDVHPYILMVGATAAASCAFMLPVATPPNAVVFGSGYLRIPDMVKTGIVVNVISIFFLTLMVYFLLPVLWGFDPFTFPEYLK